MADGPAMSEQQIEVLLKEEERFEPPPEFAAQAIAADLSVYEKAEKDFESWWESWARELHWAEPWTKVLDWDPPWAKWFVGG